MARKTQTITQRSFTLGQIRSDFLEADDLELRSNSLKTAKNVRITSARTAIARWGTEYQRIEGTIRRIVEIRPESEVIYALGLTDTELLIMDEFARVLTSFAAPWSDPADVWIEPFRNDTVIGGAFGIKVLTYNAGAWSIGNFAFAAASGGETAQPYWAFDTDVELKPSATTGNITISASAALFTSAWVGLKIRWGKREILLTSYTSPTLMHGTVVTSLPPTFELEMESVASFRVGDAVIGEDTNYQGVVLGISDPYLYVATLEYFDGPDVGASTGENLAGESGGALVLSKTKIAPMFWSVWDEPLISSHRGYPQAAASAAGRLFFLDFPLIPSLVACSSARTIYDWEVGANDDDAVTREVGDNEPRFLHAVNAGDLLLFSDRGCYYIPLRDSGILSPSTFNVVFFDQRAASPIKPVKVDSGVVFVESSGNTISAALLDGNIYLKWSVRTISTQHADTIVSPTALCGPALDSTAPEKYLFVVNSDGTLAAVSWFGDFGQDSAGFVPWDTDGAFEGVFPAFGYYWPICLRDVGGVSTRFIEKFVEGTYLDCTVAASAAASLDVNGVPLSVNGSELTVSVPAATPLIGATVHIWAGGYYGGTTLVGTDGEVVDNGYLTDDSVVGFNFVSDVGPWPVEVIESPHAGMKRCRTFRTMISVKDTLAYQCIANGKTRTVEAYRAGDDLSAPPVPRTETKRFTVFGMRDHPEIIYRKHLPGPFHALAITSEVNY